MSEDPKRPDASSSASDAASESVSPSKPGDPSGEFLDKLSGPLEYLRLLAVDEESDKIAAADADGDAAVGQTSSQLTGTAAEDPGQSVVCHLRRVLGFAPALDLHAPGDEAAPLEIGLGDERYSVEGELGRGGMGRVLMVYDQDIRRRVAMKVLREDVGQDRKATTRFLEEAQATGQLEHPNIAPVYDIGLRPSGEVFFTMKLVRGRNLGEIVRDISIGRLEVRRHFSLTRLVQVLQQASMGVHYAHVRGVVHRDLKPENVMVGDFGEVLVMDWGLAKVYGRQEASAPGGGPEEGVESYRADAGHETLDGTIQGTLAYMAPEQARGWQDEIDERTDVFGLGAILYELLTYRPPYEARSARELLDKASVGEIVPPAKRAPRNRVPPSLESICLRALALAKEDRFENANAFHEALQVWLDGTAETERQRQEAEQLVRSGKDKVSDLRRLSELERKLLQQSEETMADVKEHDSVARKAAGWELEDEAARVHQQRIETFNEASAYLRSAIDVDPSCAPAKEALANLYWDRFLEAEHARNADDMTMYRSLVERYHEGKFAVQLEGKGLLQVTTDPVGAEVEIFRVEERGRRLVEVDGTEYGATPLKLELPMGDHLLVLRKPGFRPTRYPVSIERCGKHVARVDLFRDDEIGDGFIYVPAGEVLIGGDPAAPGARGETRRYVENLFVGEFPVTFRQYCEFLDDLRRRGHAALSDRIPRTEKEGDCVLLNAEGHYLPDVDKLVESPTRDRYPAGFELDLPVLAVTWDAAAHYCEWLGQQTGRHLRLLRDVEWEKVARGAARSIHPWGDSFDWSFVKGGSSRPEPPQPEPVGAFDVDRSIYGVRDLAGSISEWCEDWYIEGVGRLLRGGSWGNMNAAAFRSAMRSGAKPELRSSVLGFRIVALPARTI